MACMCGATDCPSCGKDMGYNVKQSPSGRFYNPSYCENCGDELGDDWEEPLCDICDANLNDERNHGDG